MIADDYSSGSHPAVSLRPLTTSDATIIASWATDIDFCRAADWSQTKSPLEHEQFHQRLISKPPPDLLRLGAIADHRLIGYVDLHGDHATRRELGFVIGQRNDWNHGYGRAVAIAGLKYGFGRLGLDEIWAEALDANHGSVRILQRIHMRETGIGTLGKYLDEPTNYRQFVIQRPDWERFHEATRSIDS